MGSKSESSAVFLYHMLTGPNVSMYAGFDEGSFWDMRVVWIWIVSAFLPDMPLVTLKANL